VAEVSGPPEEPQQPLEVLVVDDHGIFADALRIAIDLQPELQCRAAVGSAEDALAEIDEHGCPDVVLLDVGLPGMDGIEAVRVLRECCPELRVVLVSADTSAQTLIDAVEAGAHGFLPKGFPFTQVLQLLRQLDEHVVVEPLSLERALQLATADSAAEGEAPAIDLTEREYQILLLLAEGLPVKQVARELHMSVHTCRGHVATLLRKFEVHSQLAAVVSAAKRGLLPNLQAGRGGPRS